MVWIVPPCSTTKSLFVPSGGTTIPSGASSPAAICFRAIAGGAPFGSVAAGAAIPGGWQAAGDPDEEPAAVEDEEGEADDVGADEGDAGADDAGADNAGVDDAEADDAGVPGPVGEAVAAGDGVVVALVGAGVEAVVDPVDWPQAAIKSASVASSAADRRTGSAARTADGGIGETPS
jgi:hypothetical protein